jgi:hypothetical protein
MKKALRNASVLVGTTPIIALIYFQSLFHGKKKAVRSFGPIMTRVAKHFLRYWVPDIPGPSHFNEFRAQMKCNFRFWSLLSDIDIAEDTPDTFKIHVRNCPFCEVFTFVGLSQVNRYICKADWEIAKDNKGKWFFARQHTIESGDCFCDHTYRRHNTPNPCDGRRPAPPAADR